MKYFKSKFEDESDEWDRVTTELVPKHKGEPKADYDKRWDKKYLELKEAYKKATPKKLSSSEWRVLKNTDSYKTDTMRKIEDAITQNKSESGHRDIFKTIQEVLGGYRCPIINNSTLVAGNTRLMAMRLLGIEPMVIVISVGLG